MKTIYMLMAVALSLTACTTYNTTPAPTATTTTYSTTTPVHHAQRTVSTTSTSY
ncbi:MAG: hypothetical protein V4501_05180 [Pseudomonadota bacterium]